jgi:trimeric autotransporter adhesin
MYKLFSIITLGIAISFNSVSAQVVTLPNALGIGTARPSQQLHTTGGVRFQSMTGIGYRLVQTDATGVLTPIIGGAAGQVLTQGATGLSWTTPLSATANAWGLSGNAAVAGNFLGTTNSTPLEFRVSGIKSGLLSIKNTTFGYEAGLFNTTGLENTFMGSNSGRMNTAGFENTFMGSNSGRMNTTGFQNTANGVSALYYNTTGFTNTATGDSSLLNNTTGIRNTAIGHLAGIKNTTGSYNTYIGVNARANSTNLSAVTVVGANSIAWAAGATSLGANTIASGQNATAIGYGSIASAFSATAIGNNATANMPNTIILGNVNNPNMRVGIGTTDPKGTLHVSAASNPNIILTNALGSKLEMGVATCNGCYSSHAVPGNGTIRMINMNKIIFNTSVSGGNGGESSFVFADEDRVNMSIWNRGRVAIGNMTYAQTNSNYALFTEKGILTEKIKIVAQGAAGWSSAPTAVLHTVGTVRHEKLPAGTGTVLVADADGNVFRSNMIIGAAPDGTSDGTNLAKINAQNAEIADLKTRLERLEKLLSVSSGAAITPNPTNEKVVLEQNRPNPANDVTVIGYELPDNYSKMALNVTDLNGKIIFTQTLTAFKGDIEINTGSWAEGTYLYSLAADGKILKTKKLVVVKN